MRNEQNKNKKQINEEKKRGKKANKQMIKIQINIVYNNQIVNRKT